MGHGALCRRGSSVRLLQNLEDFIFEAASPGFSPGQDAAPFIESEVAAISATALTAAAISTSVVVTPGLKRIVPFGPEPIVAQADGAQCNPVRQAMPKD